MQVDFMRNNSYAQGNSTIKNKEHGNGGNVVFGQVNNQSSHVVYMKKDDMLYSGGNGTGLSFYLKYAEDSTEDNPRILAKGIDEYGNEFEQIIDVKKVNPRNATLPEMRALEAYSGVEKRYGFCSLPMGSTNVGLNERQDFIAAFEKNVADMNTIGEYGIAQQYNKLLWFYEKICLEWK